MLIKKNIKKISTKFNSLKNLRKKESCKILKKEILEISKDKENRTPKKKEERNISIPVNLKEILKF